MYSLRRYAFDHRKHPWIPPYRIYVKIAVAFATTFNFCYKQDVFALCYPGYDTKDEQRSLAFASGYKLLLLNGQAPFKPDILNLSENDPHMYVIRQWAEFAINVSTKYNSFGITCY